MGTIISIFLIIAFSLFPILLWGYGITFLSNHTWNRARFFTGMFSGWATVGLIMILSKFFVDSEMMKIGALVVLFFLLFLWVWIATARGSVYIRVFLRKITAIHMSIMFLCFLMIEFLGYFFPKDILPLILFSSVSTLLFASGIEESSKHLSTVGLTAREFRFSRKDFIVFTLFVTLWFIFIENLIYLIQIFPKWSGQILYLGFMRITFAFLAHFLAASICVVTWWKALSYAVFSWKYIGLFFFGYIAAITSHALFNLMLDRGFFTGIIIFSIISYIACTQWLIGDSLDSSL